MKIQEIIDAWKIDAKVDGLNLDTMSDQVPSLHAKYVEWLSNERGALRGLEIQRRQAIRRLREYYLGTASQEDLKELNRTPCLQRILKSEVMGYVEADDLLMSLDVKIQLQSEKVDVLLEIMKSINSRNYTLSTSLNWKKLMLGG